MRSMLPALLMTSMASIPAMAAVAHNDPYIWLEEFSSPKAMAWVKSHNDKSTSLLESDSRYKTLYQEALAIGSAKDRIPMPSFLQGEIYNFWKDSDHLRGIWRKTSLEDYRNATPHWQTVLDIDALGKAEGKSWVLHGIDCFQPDQRLCLISLSDGGEDAAEIREFDLTTKQFVKDGFHLPRGKHRVTWEDKDHLLIATNWTKDDLTESGYPFIVKRLARGQSLDQAQEIYRGNKSDGGYGITPTTLRDGQNNALTVIERPLDTFHHQSFVLTKTGIKQLPIPDKASLVELVAGRVILSLDESWQNGSTLFSAGSIVSIDLDALLQSPDQLKATLVWQPTAKEAFNGLTSTKNRLLLSILDNVQGRAIAFTPTAHNQWTAETLPLPDKLAIELGSSDSQSDRAFIEVSGFVTPSTLYLADTAQDKIESVKALPPQFDASEDVVEQLEATSTDGTKIPYFVVHRKNIKYDGTTPTLMTAYGGFQVSNTPYYSASIGKLWLEKGGAFVLANIRGGGEFGPAWHEAGLGTKRQIIYDDFASVAKDLMARKITSPRHLGIQGGSNGGLLMGVEMTQHPELWNAVVIQVPLLDMLRISKIAAGASWQGEYGDVNQDPKVRAFWEGLSPYHNLKQGVKYPEPFIFTTTKDDRVGPQHARKFAARMEEMKLPFYYYENTEGGHGSGADLKQTARTQALTMTYLYRKLL
ncbi:prolyl oligopeptidase family serine peptidase [Zymomonas mobilis]|uniref:Prolyl oligopeptidase n=1 Tax=Zymomonas mobilis subsp. mobilis (strain ATCC 10988 / DSM 424 / LMG 404 / NCIMB 8938 / NRRL B-806 / ZM1) TaxID=555217 RepID=A0A0H3G0P9_ZYMMA|nr:prolyl oligopeptidase family serine peptidase [Zymomonas mobilis]AEH62342.1 Prolyl oligopeptidase [Zymomonas mobilis subsp. mobilis ATCC 10988]TQL28063.1 prolyl oligopeptidase [Zymomonas mobilis]TQL29998.1 prolyl oligopeptidase [Zymomonas mobilis]